MRHTGFENNNKEKIEAYKKDGKKWNEIKE
jgi:hypothetical protein